jgi:uncharacterized protein YjhX (UPF0386 family)
MVNIHNISIKQVTIHDIEQLQHIGRQTFQETFSASNSDENMETYLRDGFSTEKLTTGYFRDLKVTKRALKTNVDSGVKVSDI